MAIPIVVAENDVPLPTEACYIIGAGGVYLQKKNAVSTGLVKVPGISRLQKIQERLTWTAPSIPVELFAQALLFFRYIQKTMKAEAVVLLHYHPVSAQYSLVCPSQEVVGLSIGWYDKQDRIEGYVLMGSIHSHESMEAFHSFTDIGDEEYFDGLHITVGHVDRPYFSISCTAVMNGRRFELAPGVTVQGISPVQYKPPRRPIWNYRARTAARSQNITDDLNHARKQECLSHETPTDQLPEGNFSSGYAMPATQFWDIPPQNKEISYPPKWREKVCKKPYTYSEKEYLQAFLFGDNEATITFTGGDHA